MENPQPSYHKIKYSYIQNLKKSKKGDLKNMKKIIEYKNIKPICTIDTEGNIENIKTGKSLKYATTSDGYYTVGLQQNDNTRKIFYLHSKYY